jgi:hypothetical protein
MTSEFQNPSAQLPQIRILPLMHHLFVIPWTLDIGLWAFSSHA